MRLKRLMMLGLYSLFVLLIVITFILSMFITKKEEKIENSKEDFLILKKDLEISALYYDGENIWVGGIDGVSIYHSETKEEIGHIDGLTLVYSAEIIQTPDGIVWIGHEEGITGILRSKMECIVEFCYPDIPKGRVNTVEWDGEKLWVGTYNGAASIVKTENGWKVDAIYDKDSGLCSNSVNVIRCIDDVVWFASYLDSKNGGISIKKDAKIQHLTTDDGIPHSYITSLQEVGTEKMLVGTGYMDTGGMALIEKIDNKYQVVETYFMNDGLPGEKVRQLYLDSKGYLWITTEYDGILIVNYDKKGLNKPLEGIYYREENGLSDNEIKCIVETQQDYWLGGKYGLTVIEHSLIKDKLQ